MSGWRRGSWIVGAGLLGCFIVAPSSWTQTSPALFDDGYEVPAQRHHYASIRSRRLGLDRTLLADLLRGKAGHVRLNLFKDVVFEADRYRVDVLGAGAVWVGRLVGESGIVHLSVQGSVLSGHIESFRGTFSIGSDADGVPTVEQIDTSTFPADAYDVRSVDVAGDALGATSSSASPVVAADDGSTIDVMIVYTAQARMNAGGTSAMQSLVNLTVSQTNTAYVSSQAAQRLRLVYTGEVGYTESGDLSTDLDRLTYSAGSSQDPSGYLDTVLQLRDTYGADLVQLIVDTTNANGNIQSGACGLGWLNGNSSAYAPYGFSVAERVCASDNLTTPHEFGHNQGLKHGHEEAGSDSSGYGITAYGFKAADHSFRTIMAYDCFTAPSCPRVGLFSNPNVTFNGLSAGVPGTGTDAANNADALNGTRVTVANWRASRVGATATTTPSPTSTPRSTPTPAPTPTPTPGPTPGGAPPSVPSRGDNSDFDGNGWSDLVVQATDGRVGIWYLKDSIITSGAYVRSTPMSDWTVRAVGDFNGDGWRDLILQTSDGRVGIWYLNATTLMSGAYLRSVPMSDWVVKGAADFNGDGQVDLVLQASDGRVGIWYMNGGTMVSGAYVRSTPMSDWVVKGTGDFNHDGWPDLLLQASDGRVGIWYMNGGTMVSGAYVRNTPMTDWVVTGTGDLNHDRQTDIVLQTSDGRVGVWYMNGGTMVSGAFVRSTPIAGWVVSTSK